MNHETKITLGLHITGFEVRGTSGDCASRRRGKGTGENEGERENDPSGKVK